MSKRNVILYVGGGALVVAGYVFRRPLRATLSRYSGYAHGFVAELAEDLVQKVQTRDQLRGYWGSQVQQEVDDFLEHPETGTARSRPED